MLKRITSSEFRRLYLPQVLKEGLNVENLANTEWSISIGVFLILVLSKVSAQWPHSQSSSQLHVSSLEMSSAEKA